MRTLILVLLFGSYALAQQKVTAGDEYTKTLAPKVVEALQRPHRDAQADRALFKAVRERAEAGSAVAACDLGMLYKEGLGHALNLNKARKWFLKSHKKGNAKAAYSLGYLYLKGLGNIEQDYQKALHWFNQSDDPMAVHWTAKCHYHGLGVPQDRDRAIALLKDNPIGNSAVLLAQWEYDREHPGQVNTETSLTDLTDTDGPLTNGITGTWQGHWEQLDWSGSTVMRSDEIRLAIADTGTGIHRATITTLEGTVMGDVLPNGNELVFPELTLTQQKRYTDRTDEVTLDHRLTSLKYRIDTENGAIVLDGNLETYINNWSEPGPPMRLRLQKVAGGLSDTIKEAFAQQEDHFIKVYPNPFEADLLVHYTLDTDAEVHIALSDYRNPGTVLQKRQRKQPKGDRTVSFGRLSELRSGLYLLQLEVNGTAHSRIIIKK